MFPNGWNSDEYGQFVAWELMQWAWEFLRRNKEFQADCQEVSKGIRSKREIARKWGLRRFKPSDEEFGAGKKAWISSRFRSYSYEYDGNDELPIDQEISLAPGEVAMVFSLHASTSDQLRIAKRRLKKREKEWKQHLKTVRNVPQKEMAGDFMQMLQALDARAAGKKHAEIANHFWPDGNKPRGRSAFWPAKSDSALEAVNELFKRAKRYVGGGYLTLALRHRVAAARRSEKNNARVL